MYKPNFSGDTPHAQAAHTYLCVACEQQVNSIGGQADIEGRTNIAPMPVCGPCYARAAHDIAFRQRVDARIEKTVRLFELQELCQRLGAPKEAFHYMATVAGLI
jgi:hypothetical protein